ncbi:MAG: ribosome silencing factor [Burkholderiaceae bacterium]|nr:ribosome silencing factor [Burkholderiaceae bacterium]
MDIKDLQKIVINALEDVKAQDIQLFDTTGLTSMFDRIAVASGTSSRQTKALAMSVRDKVKQAGGNVVSMEGENTGEWVLVDLGDMVVHVMQPTIRAYYRLEEIWGEKAISLATAKRTPRKPAVAAKTASKTSGKKTPATKTASEPASKKRAPRKVTTKTAVTETAAARTPAKKTAAAKKPAAKTAKPATKKSASTAAPKSSAKRKAAE